MSPPRTPSDPGVLILSRFAGAAAEFKEGALLVNPYDPDAVARRHRPRHGDAAGGTQEPPCRALCGAAAQRHFRDGATSSSAALVGTKKFDLKEKPKGRAAADPPFAAH